MPPNVSVIIRTKNEGRILTKLLASLKNQTLNPKEIIIADNLSTDHTISIAKSFHCKIVTIPNPFNHAVSCNLPISKCRSEIIVLLNGHSLPLNDTWLQSGASHFQDPKIAGVFGNRLNDSRASFWERFETFYNRFNKNEVTIYSSFNSNVLLNTAGCIIRKSLWKNYQFNEKLSAKTMGGEDADWGYHFLKLGYKIVLDPNFSVYHCHGDNFVKFYKRQFAYVHMFLENRSRYS